MSESSSNEKMNPVPTPLPRYYKISFIRDDKMAAAQQYCVPKSWVTVTNKEKNEAMVAYPEEPRKTTEERARRCDDPQETWMSVAAHIRGFTNHFSSLVCSEEKERYELPSMTAQLVPSRSSTSAPEKQCNKSSEVTSTVLGIDYLERLKHEISKAYEKFRGQMENSRGTRVRNKVYMKTAAFDECQKSARNCLHLARLLTRSIFSNAALEKCIYVGKDAPRPDLSLDEGAVVVIVQFVRSFGFKRNWNLPSERSIRNAIRYELLMAKMKTP